MTTWIDLCIDACPTFEASARRRHDGYHRLEKFDVLEEQGHMSLVAQVDATG